MDMMFKSSCIPFQFSFQCLGQCVGVANHRSLMRTLLGRPLRTFSLSSMCLSHVLKYILAEKAAFLTWKRILRLYTCTLCGRFVESGKGLKAGKDCSDNLQRCLECQRSKNPCFSFKQPVETQLTLLRLLSYHHQIKCSQTGARLQLYARHLNDTPVMSCLLSSQRSFTDLISVIDCAAVFAAALCICCSERTTHDQVSCSRQ